MSWNKTATIEHAWCNNKNCHIHSYENTRCIYTHTHTHTHITFQSHVFRKQELEQNIKKLWCIVLEIHFLSVSLSSHLYCLMPLQNTSSYPPFQNFKQCIGQVMFLQCDILIAPLEYIRAEIYPVNAQLHCRNYKWQLPVSATEQSSSSCLNGKYRIKFYTCSLHTVKNNKHKISWPYI